MIKMNFVFEWTGINCWEFIFGKSLDDKSGFWLWGESDIEFKKKWVRESIKVDDFLEVVKALSIKKYAMYRKISKKQAKKRMKTI